MLKQDCTKLQVENEMPTDLSHKISSQLEE
jgi:hypothetical protein